ncbi:glucose-inhibited division protein A [Oceanicola granulosus HTCC2516]|uniref:Glucose-inhibited division protein A n=2 Tax=Oceanicola granulosus TaxID=252302 RepID=Q2CCL4_OCEGH|nr:glucose-inhibited division protein A [Oceanicola granulosus HTCC2516]
MAHASIDAYHSAQADDDRRVCDLLRAEIAHGLPEAEGRIWHAHPVWFLQDNPIVGYSKLKDAVRLLFWSGQSFATPGLTASGTFKAAERRYASAADIDREPLQAWLAEARTIQWDYKNIVKRKGRLERLA